MLVIGNGESRKHLDISKYAKTKVGCNAIFRDFYVHHLICCDRRMVIEAQEDGKKVESVQDKPSTDDHGSDDANRESELNATGTEDILEDLSPVQGIDRDEVDEGPEQAHQYEATEKAGGRAVEAVRQEQDKGQGREAEDSEFDASH